MKCSIKSLLALMVGVVMLESCNDSEFFETKSGAAKTGNMSFTATVEGAESRASFYGDTFSFMKPDSVISVFSSGENNKFTMNDEGIFTGNCEDNDEYYAVSPYSENNKVQFNGSTYDFVIDWNGAEQTVDLNENYAPMVARVRNVGEGAFEVPLVFQNVCGFIKFTTDYVCKSITLKSRGGEDLAAKTLYVDYDSNCNPHVYLRGTPNQTITLTGKDGGNIEAGTYYIPVLPCNLSKGVDITFTNKYNEKTCTKSFADCVTIVSGLGEALDLGTINIKSEMVHLAGKGTEADPYLIRDFDQLCEMRDFVNNSTGGADCYKLVDDIDGGGSRTQPIGTFKKPFFGKFDGNNKTIKNISLEHSDVENFQTDYNPLERTCVTALFGYVRNAAFRNLIIDNMVLLPENDRRKIYKYADEFHVVKSPFIGMSYGPKDSKTTISGITITANQNVSTDEAQAINHIGFVYGGVIGASAGNLLIEQCTNYSCVEGKINYVTNDMSNKLLSCGLLSATFGGILGCAIGGLRHCDLSSLDYCADVDITKCRNFGKFNLKLQNNAVVEAGGILGQAASGLEYDVAVSIYSCVNYGTIKTDGLGSVKAEYSYGNDPESVGGIVGFMHSDGYYFTPPVIANCINNGELSTFYPAGGIIGKTLEYPDRKIKMDYCASYGLIRTKNSLSSLVGEGQSSVSIGDYYDNLKEAAAKECCDFMNRKAANKQQSDPAHYSRWKVSGDKPDLDFTGIKGPVIP